MYEFLVDINVSPLIANFIARPEWLHIGSAVIAVLLILGLSYLLRLDIDPIVLGEKQSFNATIEKIVFWPSLIGILLWAYYFEWDWPEKIPQGFYWNKFTIALLLIMVLVLGRAIVRLSNRDKSEFLQFFEHLPFYLMVIFQFLVPLVTYYQLERNSLMPKEELGIALTCIFIGYFLIRSLLGLPTHVPRNPVSIWVWLLLAYMILTLIIMPYRLAAIKNLLQWVTFATCFLVGMSYIRDQRRRDFILLVCVITAVTCSLWGFWKYFDIPYHFFGLESEDGAGYFYKTPSAGRYFLLAGFFANPNYYGEWLAMTIFIALGLLLSTNSYKLRIFLSIALAINCFEMVALYNRAGWLGMFIAGAFVLIGTFFARVPVFQRISKPALISGIAGLSLILLLTGVIFNERESDESPLSGTPLERLQSMKDFSSDETFRNRLTMWRSAYLMLKDPEHSPQRLIFGGGLGQFEIEYLKYQTQVLETYDFKEWFHNVIPTFRAHNDHIQMLVEVGIIGTAFYMLIWFMFFKYGFTFLREETDPSRRFLALGIMAACASCLTSAMFSFPLHQSEHGGLLFTAMGLLVFEIAQRNRMRTISTEEFLLSSEHDKKDEFHFGKKKKVRKSDSLDLLSSYDENFDLNTRAYRTIKWNLHPSISLPLSAIVLWLTIWGVYTQVINFKSQYLVVRGISALRTINTETMDADTIDLYADTAASNFWRAYQLDPTNGRAEFFHGFALTKKGDYQSIVLGIKHLEEGQILYPQSDTHYALAMSYESRRNEAKNLVYRIRNEIPRLEAELKTAENPDEIQSKLDLLHERLPQLEEDIKFSQQKAIEAYVTAAKYYPVKIEYYREIIRLYEEEQKYDEVIYWAERALIVDEWLIKKPNLRWSFFLSLGKAHRAIGSDFYSNGDEIKGKENFDKALSYLESSKELTPRAYYPYYEMAQIYEKWGDMAKQEGNLQEASQFYATAKENYVLTLTYKDNVPENTPPFNYSYFLLGRIYEKLGDSERAVEYYKKMLTVSLYSPSTDEYQSARERIFALTGEWVGEPKSEKSENIEP